MTNLLRNLLLGAGILSLAGGGVMGIAWMRQSPRTHIASVAESGAAVLVAAKAIPAGATLSEQDLVWRSAQIPKGPAGSFGKAEHSALELVGAVTKRNLVSGEMLLSSAVILPTQRKFLAAVLTPGFEAVTIPVDLAQSAAGLIVAGDRVDVVLVRQPGEKDAGRRAIGESILRAARVVAVGRLNPADDKPPSASLSADVEAGPKTLTLEVRPDDARRLLLAAQLGRLELILRALGDSRADTGPAPMLQLSQPSEPAAGAPPIALAGPAAGARVSARRELAEPPVRILRGSKAGAQ
jgi:pilus assembly protein CpaB